MFPKTVSVQQIQRNYRKIFDEVMTEQEPVIILNNNKPEVVVVEIHQFEVMQQKAEQYELEMARKAIEEFQKEKKRGKLKKLTSLADLGNED